jgi:hypothetical protein
MALRQSHIRNARPELDEVSSVDTCFASGVRVLGRTLERVRVIGVDQHRLRRRPSGRHRLFGLVAYGRYWIRFAVTYRPHDAATGDRSNDRLATIIDVDVFNRDPLLALPSMLIQCSHHSC